MMIKNIPNVRIGGPYSITVSYVGYNTYQEKNIELVCPPGALARPKLLLKIVPSMVRLLNLLSWPANDTPEPAVDATDDDLDWGTNRKKSFKPRLIVGIASSISFLIVAPAPVLSELRIDPLSLTTVTSSIKEDSSPNLALNCSVWPSDNSMFFS